MRPALQFRLTPGLRLVRKRQQRVRLPLVHRPRQPLRLLHQLPRPLHRLRQLLRQVMELLPVTVTSNRRLPHDGSLQLRESM